MMNDLCPAGSTSSGSTTIHSSLNLLNQSRRLYLINDLEVDLVWMSFDVDSLVIEHVIDLIHGK